MSSRKWKIPRTRIVALAVGIGVLGSLATAPASFAANPPQVGQNCQLDGKINGGGSTFQTNAINNAFTYGFQDDVCGPVGTASNLNSTYLSPQGTSALATGDPAIFNFGAANTSVQGMVAYNVGVNISNALVQGTNGSGAGLKRLSCRTDMFAGTDLPYNGGVAAFSGQLGVVNGTTNGLDGPPGSESGGSAPNYGCNTQSNINTATVPPPYGPTPSFVGTTPSWPNSADTRANAMGMPVAAGAVAYATNLNGMCSNTNGPGGTTDIPVNLNLTQGEFDQIWQGTINQWNDPTLVGTNALLGSATFATTTANGGNAAGSLTVASVTGYYPTGVLTITGFGTFPYTSVNTSTNTFTGATIPANIPAGTVVGEVPDNCSGNIQRVERADNSGTTAITMFTLAGIDNGDLCPSGTNHWYTNATMSSNFDTFPKGCVSPAPPAGTGTTAPNAIFATSGGNPLSGSPALIALTDSTNGAIGYAELGLWPSPLPSGVSFANVQNHTATAFVAPGSAGAKSNCSLPATPPTGSTPTQAVGLSLSGWSNNTNGGNPPPTGKQDIADTGSGYPACGLTFDLAYQGSGTLAGEIGGTTPGCTANPTTTTAAVVQGPPPLPGNSLTVSSTAAFPNSGTISVQTSSGVQYLNYTGRTTTSFFGIPITGVGSLASGSTVTASSTVTLITGSCQTVSGPVVGMTNDQVMTEYAYFTYVFSPLGQNNVYLPSQTLDPLPIPGWTNPLQSGWQQNWVPSPF